MSGCCGIMSRGEAEIQLEDIRKTAKDYAKEKKESVIIFWDPVEGRYSYVLESASGSVPPFERISHY